jgi:H+/gluconate symporter-like permease
MSVVGILIALGLLIWLTYRGWTILLLAPLCALIAALLAGEPLLANWTQTFMSNAAGFVAQFFSDLFPRRAVRQADGSQRFG